MNSHRDQATRVYTSNRSKRAHWTWDSPSNARSETICGLPPSESVGSFLGTGEDWEYRVAERLPLCTRCVKIMARLGDEPSPESDAVSAEDGAPSLQMASSASTRTASS